MPKSIQITLTTAGTNLGPTLDLYCIDQSGVSPTPFQTGVALGLLQSGYVTVVGDSCIGVRVKSNGVCTTFADITISSPTTTTSTTTTTTVCPCSVYLLTGNTPVVSFSFTECGSGSESNIPLGLNQTAIYCIDNAQGKFVSGNGTYTPIGTQCCTPGSITTSTTTSTTSTTTTTTNSFNFEINNQTSLGAIETVTPEFYTIVETIDSITYGTHGEYSGPIGVTITDTNSGTVTLYINGFLVECINTIGSGTYIFSSVVINSTDLVNIIYSYGFCL